jgi:hypothetical protein
MYDPTPAERDARGNETHPAFGFIQANRTSSHPGQVLFDSDVRHGHTVRVIIGHMTRQRDLHQDWKYPGQQEIEVEMSEAQWASFVSSMSSSGVPCTLRYIAGQGDLPGLEYAPRLAESMVEVRAAADEAFGAIRRAMNRVDALDPKAGVKERREAMAALRSAITNATANVEFAGRRLTEHTENVVQRARADVEAMVSQQVTRLGLDAADLTEPLALPGGED